MKKITTQVAEISYDIDRILRITLFKDAQIGLAEAIINHEATVALTKREKFLMIVDAGENVTLSKEARAYAAKLKENDGRIACAFVVTSTANKLIGNFYINFNKPEVTTKLFSSKKKAVEWLEGFLYLTEMEPPLPKIKKQLKSSLI
jgi:hypothetical protein